MVCASRIISGMGANGLDAWPQGEYSLQRSSCSISPSLAPPGDQACDEGVNVEVVHVTVAVHIGISDVAGGELSRISRRIDQRDDERIDIKIIHGSVTV